MKYGSNTRQIIPGKPEADRREELNKQEVHETAGLSDNSANC